MYVALFYIKEQLVRIISSCFVYAGESDSELRLNAAR